MLQNHIVPDITKKVDIGDRFIRPPTIQNLVNSSHIDSSSIGSNVDTLDSGFSSDRFHSIYNHQHHLLPGDKVFLYKIKI